MTKQKLANQILTLLGINTRTSSAEPEEIEDTLRHTEDWILAQNAVGRRIGWIENGETPDPEQETGLPKWAVMGVVNSMAIYLAPYFEKVANQEVVRNAAIGMQTIAAKTVEIQEVQYPRRFPRGQANGVPWGPKYYHPENRVVTGGDYLTDEGDDPIITP